MIYSNQFVWLHFPKCAGLKIERLFQEYFADEVSLTQDPVGVKYDLTIAWHDSITQRLKRDPGFKLSDKTVICSFRRLPSWLISRYNYEFRRYHINFLSLESDRIREKLKNSDRLILKHHVSLHHS